MNRFAGTTLLIVLIGVHSPKVQAQQTPHYGAGMLAPSTAAATAVRDAFGRLPLIFEANRGQTDQRVKFISRGAGQTLFLTSTEAVLALRPERHSGVVLQMQMVGANEQAEVRGLEPSPGRANYFVGNNPAKWLTDIATYGKVHYRAIYPGIDLVYYGNPQQLEFDFIVAAGADPGRIRIELSGAEAMSIDGEDVVVHAGGREIRLQQPRLYQDVGGVRQEVAGRYVVEGRQVRFHVAAYDHGQPLVIDPVIVYSTYLGGSFVQAGRAIAVDASGSAYVTGDTTSTNFPTTAGAFQTTGGGNDEVFVTKLNPAGTALVYSTYLAGNGLESGLGIAVDSTGNAYVVGDTNSTNFPATAGSFQTAIGGSVDGFVTKLNATGSALVYSTFLGGNDDDVAFDIALDASGNAYVTGYAASTNFPVTAGVIQSTNASGRDVFVTKLNAAGTALVYSTYLGGGNWEDGQGIAVDASGNAYVAGNTTSANFPVTTGAFQSTNGGFQDLFVAKLNATGTALVYATYLGGSQSEIGGAIAIDQAGSAYVTGSTSSMNFPITAGAFKTVKSGATFAGNAFVTKLNAAGTALAYSTYLGVGHGDDIAVDASGSTSVAGYTSGGFPVTPGTPAYGGDILDGFVTTLNAAGTALVYSTYLGGNGIDTAEGIALDASTNVYVTGQTFSTNFPTTAGAFQPTGGAPQTDVFVTKIALCAAMAPTWTPTGNMPTDRLEHTATLLPNGKVLIAGGRDAATSLNPVATAVLYNPTTGMFAPTGSLATARFRHTATLLPNGKVLVAGGVTTPGSLCLSSAELFDPAANNGVGAFTSAGSLNMSRADYTATLLPNGKVLMAGGSCSGGSSAEIYDPAANNGTGGSTATGTMASIRVAHTATLLTNGKVLVAGGMDTIAGTVLTSAEIFDPSANVGAGAFSSTGSLAAARQSHRATLLANGKVLLTGGYDASISALASAELFDPAAGTFGATGAMSAARAGHTATRLSDGKVLIAGGLGQSAAFLNSAELYDQAAGGGAGAFAATTQMGAARDGHSATLLTGGQVLAAGGRESGAVALDSAEIYSVSACAAGPLSSLSLLLANLGLPTGIYTGLAAKLDAAQASFLREASGIGGPSAACNQLDAFVNQVSAQRGRALRFDQADDLIAGAGVVKRSAACLIRGRGD